MDEVAEVDSLKAADGLENVMTGLGTSADSNSHNHWTPSGNNSDYSQLITRYREDWVSQKVCNIIPQDTTRKWRTIDSDDGTLADKQFKIAELFREAYKWARVYGTSFLVLDLADGAELTEPLDINNLKKGCINSLRVIERVRMVATGIMEVNPMSPHYGLPVYYSFLGSPSRIHHTRVIRFEGTDLPVWEKQRNQWYSDSTLIPLMSTIDNFHVAAAAASQLCKEATIDVVTVDGLQALLTNPEGEKAIMKRFRVMKQMKSVYNVLLLDDTEEYDTKSIALSGVKDLIWEYLKIIAAAVGIPATRFLSASPDGMNATGESDLVNYIEFLTGLQTSVFDPRLEIIDAILQKHFGIKEWDYEWNCIFPESSAQKAERELNIVQQLKDLVEAGIITREVALEALKNTKMFGALDLGSSPTTEQFVAQQGKTNNQQESK